MDLKNLTLVELVSQQRKLQKNFLEAQKLLNENQLELERRLNEYDSSKNHIADALEDERSGRYAKNNA